MRVITRGKPTEKNPVLWLLDEMAHIGQMRAIEDAVTLMRGMGMRLWFFFQSLDQLKTCFGDKAPDRARQYRHATVFRDQFV